MNQVKQNGLQSHLWEAANILRGSAVDRTDWKGYILPPRMVAMLMWFLLSNLMPKYP